MNLLDEKSIHLFNSAYCYLRLSGLSAEESFVHLRSLPQGLFMAASHGELWVRLLEKLSHQSSLSYFPNPHSPPPIVRGHMRYLEHSY